MAYVESAFMYNPGSSSSQASEEKESWLRRMINFFISFKFVFDFFLYFFTLILFSFLFLFDTENYTHILNYTYVYTHDAYT